MARDPNCIFCKIVAGDVPAARVLETEEGIAFLDIAPLADGHLLWIPKEHYTLLHDIPADVLARLCAPLARLGNAVTVVTDAAGYNLLQNNGPVAGQEVQHVHFHLIPRDDADGLGYRWKPTEYPAGRAEELNEQYRRSLA